MRLTKEQSRKRWREIRALWCEFDPIGVVNSLSGPDDEYDGYLGPSLRLLERGATVEEIASYLAKVTLDHMGLSDSRSLPRRVIDSRINCVSGTAPRHTPAA